MKGGKQPGAGRPPEPPKFIMRLRFPLSQKTTIMKLGGARMVKRLADEELKKDVK